MDYLLFFNQLSLLAPNEDKAYSLLFDAFQGVLSLNVNNDRFYLYYDGDCIDDCELSKGFTYSNFKGVLKKEREMDLIRFIAQITDKAPCLDYVSEECIKKATMYTTYMNDIKYAQNMDILNFTWCENGMLLSLATNELWETHIINFFIQDETYKSERQKIHNISKEEHAERILELLEETIEDILPAAYLSNDFIGIISLNMKTKTKLNIS